MEGVEFLTLEPRGRGGRAVECTGLENRRAQALVGSNPTPSVIHVVSQHSASTGIHGPPFEPTRASKEGAWWVRVERSEATGREAPVNPTPSVIKLPGIGPQAGARMNL